MSVGLRIRNQATGQLQIANGYKNLDLEKSGTLNTASFVGGSGILMSAQDNDYLHVFRFISPTINATSGFAQMQVAGQYRVYVSPNSPSKSLEYYSFAYSGYAPTGPVGLRLRDSNGTVFYDSRKKSLRVLQAIQLPPRNTNEIVNLGQFFPGTRIGVSIANPRYYYSAPYPEVCYMYTDAIHMDSSNNIYMSNFSLWARTAANAFTTGDTTMGNTDSTLLIVDLTEIPLGFNG